MIKGALGVLLCALFADSLAFEITQKEERETPEQTFWKVYELQDVEAATGTLEELREDFPDWSPSLELLNALDRLRARAAILDAVSEDRAARGLEIYQRRPQLRARGCEDPELLWAIADAHHQQGDTSVGRSVLDQTLRDCDSVDIQEGTVAAYAETFGPKTARAAVKQLHDKDAISADREKSLMEIARQAESDLPALAEAFAQSNERLEREQELAFERQIINERNRQAANIFGWYWHRLERSDQARHWFKRSRDWGVNANAIEGLTRSYLAENEPSRAEATARPWRTEWDNVSEAYALAAMRLADSDVQIPAGAMQAITTFAKSQDNRNLWLSLGWHHLEAGTGPPAIRAFKNAQAIQTSPETIEGLVLAHRETNNEAKAQALVTEYIDRDQTYRKHLEPLEQPGSSRVTEWFEQGEYARVVGAMADSEMNRDQALMLAWSHYHLDNLREAHRLFSELHEDQPSQETAEGLKETRQLGR